MEDLRESNDFQNVVDSVSSGTHVGLFERRNGFGFVCTAHIIGNCWDERRKHGKEIL